MKSDEKKLAAVFSLKALICEDEAASGCSKLHARTLLTDLGIALKTNSSLSTPLHVRT